MKQEPIYVGIDVSKSRLDVGVRPGGDGWIMAYDEAGIRDLASRLQSLEPAAVLLVAGYAHDSCLVVGQKGGQAGTGGTDNGPAIDGGTAAGGR